MWDLIVSVPDNCLSFYFTGSIPADWNLDKVTLQSSRKGRDITCKLRACLTDLSLLQDA